MSIQQLVPSVFCVGSKDQHRVLFDQLMPLSEGTSYNAYLIKGSEKTALIDTVYPPCHQELIQKLKDLHIDRIDYIIANHGEQDHTGTLPELLKLFPEAKIVTNAKCKEITMGFLPLQEDQYQVVTDGEELSLGDKTIRFMMAPWVHWPDTMFSFLKEDRILFSTDFFGAHATNYDVFWDGKSDIASLAKAYYAEIMMPFAKIWVKYLDKIESLHPQIIAPSHGPAYKDPSFIINLYRQWAEGPKENKTVIVSVSMYGSTDKMVSLLKKELENKGITVKHYDAVHLKTTELAKDLVDCQGIIVASPTVLTGPHPAVIEPVFLLNVLKPTVRYIGLIGSYSWGTLIANQITALLTNHKNTPILDPVLCKGTPTEETVSELKNLASTIAEMHNR